MLSLTSFHAILEELEARQAQASAGQDLQLYISGRGPRIAQIKIAAAACGIKAKFCEAQVLDKINPSHRGVILQVAETAQQNAPGDRQGGGSWAEFENYLYSIPEGVTQLVLVLDHIEDPHNLGAILRSAEAFAVDLVILPRARASHISETVHSSSAGAVSHLRLVQLPNLARSLRDLREAGFEIAVAETGGQLPLPLRSSQQFCLVVGNEGRGVARLLRDLADQHLGIPMQGKLSSLNVSVATGILLYALRK